MCHKLPPALDPTPFTAPPTPPHPPPPTHNNTVMNTQEEIAQAFADYRNGMLQRKDDDVWAADEL